MIFGDPQRFAIESCISEVYPSRQAVGCFVIHLNGKAFGITAPNATLLACSYDEVAARIKNRGTHIASFGKDWDINRIVNLYLADEYADSVSDAIVELKQRELADELFGNRVTWAPDGDAAFDDGSHVLQIDVDTCVRIIGFKRGSEAPFDMSTLTEVWLNADTYYGLLALWKDSYEKALSEYSGTGSS